MGGEVTLVGRVVSTGVIPTRKRLRIFRAILRDESGVIECAWPGQAFLERSIRPGQLLLVTGPVRFFHGRHVVPREQIVLADAGEDDGEEGQKGREGLVLPIYPATEGLSHRQIRRIIGDHLEALLDVATAFANRLVGEGEAYLPLSYDRLEVKGVLPRRLYSYIRTRDSAQSRKETITFQVTLMDEHGQELVEIEGALGVTAEFR